VIEEGAAGAHRLGQIEAPAGAALVLEVNARCLRDIHEPDCGPRRAIGSEAPTRPAAAGRWQQGKSKNEKGNAAPHHRCTTPWPRLPSPSRLLFTPSNCTFSQ